LMWAGEVLEVGATLTHKPLLATSEREREGEAASEREREGRC
jgi:hypothetical protein